MKRRLTIKISLAVALFVILAIGWRILDLHPMSIDAETRASIVKGMSMDDVRDRLGRPAAVLDEVWAYEPERDNSSFVVIFDQNGRVDVAYSID